MQLFSAYGLQLFSWPPASTIFLWQVWVCVCTSDDAVFVCLDLCVGGCLCVWVWGESLRVRGVRGECVNSCFKSKERVVKSTFHLVHIMIRSVFPGCVRVSVCVCLYVFLSVWVCMCVTVSVCLSKCLFVCLCLSVCVCLSLFDSFLTMCLSLSVWLFPVWFWLRIPLRVHAFFYKKMCFSVSLYFLESGSGLI